MIRELDSVVLTHDFQEHGLAAGEVGAVVHCYANGPMYEVEFVSGSGHTVALVTVNETNIRQIQAREILHVRALAA
ncbi:MAG: DUF4926 domain-containing protein [Acidobacteria bacterium]|nr:DUF4926 domain-containing protein [Acidobacteriota bacterium]MBI3427220.1 DUF4926 domain-containing protein [Acidobacteriota bacterium]